MCTVALAHKSVVGMAAVRGFELVDHPPYSLDLVPSDYFLFPKNTCLARKQYRTDDEVIISAVEDFVEDQDAIYHGNPSAATPMEEVCGPQGILF